MLGDTAVANSVSHFSSIVEKSNLTELQLLYWIGHKLRPSAAHFNNAFLFTFPTAIDSRLFKLAFGTAVQQYDALRTIIEEVEGAPQQRVLPDVPTELAIVDLSRESDPTTALVSWQQRRVQHAFLLAHCLYDSALIKLNDDRFAWFLNQHHLITDASSFFLIANSVIQEYSHLLEGSHLPPMEKPSLAQYLAAQQRYRASSRAAKSQTFWQEKIAHKPEPLQFYGRSPHRHSSQVQRWTHNLGPMQTAQLQAVAESIDLGAATPELRQFCLTAALFFSLLHQMTGNMQLGFVTTVHNRGTRLARETVGPLMELCPVTVTLAPNDTLAALVQKVAAEMKELLRHYRYGASRAASDMALEVMFTFVQRPLLTLNNQPVAQQIVHPGCGSEHLALHVHHLVASDSYELYLDFHQDVFSRAEQDHATRTLLALITAVCQNPDFQLNEVQIPWPQGEVPHIQVNGARNGRSQPAYVPPSTPLEVQLQRIWEEVLGRSPIGVHDDFFALGGESWQAMNFLSKFEAATDQYLPLATLLTASTIASLAQQVGKTAPPEALIEIQPGAPGTAPLFLIPGAAGNTLAMNRIGQHLAASQPVYTFEMPEFNVGNAPEAEVEKLAAYYLEAMQQAQPRGPYFLGGYSAGSILAYEVAQQLWAKGEAVKFLAVIDMPAPNPALKYWWQLCHFLATLFRMTAASEDKVFLLGRDCWSRLIYFWVRGLWTWLGHYGRLAQHFWQLPLSAKWQRLWRWVRRIGVQDGAEPTAHPILRDMDPSSLTDPRARSLFTLYDRAARKYLPRPYAGRITLLRCPLGYGRKEIRSPYPHYGWQKLARQVDVHVIEAQGHLALMQEPAVAEVGQKLQNSLLRATHKED